MIDMDKVKWGTKVYHADLNAKSVDPAVFLNPHGEYAMVVFQNSDHSVLVDPIELHTDRKEAAEMVADLIRKGADALYEQADALVASAK